MTGCFFALSGQRNRQWRDARAVKLSIFYTKNSDSLLRAPYCEKNMLRLRRLHLLTKTYG